MKHVLWIGGSPASGKTAVATRLARRHGLCWYSADWRTWEHRDRAIEAGHPPAIRWESMSPDERWTAGAAELIELSLHAERGPMIIDDLRRLPTSRMIVAEGSPLSPSVVSSAIAERSQAVWLIPTAKFQRARLEEQNLPRGPQRLYLLLAAVIEREAREHQDPGRTPSLLREANAATAAQVRAYYTRPWADGDADSVVREFMCECGDRGCDASVELAVGSLSAEPLLAPGHG